MNNYFPVSVIIPVYNGQNSIIRALDSIIGQSTVVDEIVIVNDGSTDNSVSLVNEYIKKNNINFIHIVDKINGGVSSARNAGICHAKNEIIAFLDCDDEWVSDKIEEQLKWICKSDVVLVGGNHSNKKIKMISFKIAKQINYISLFDLLFKNYFQTSTIMTKKSAVLSFGGFDETQTHAEEGQFYYNLSTKGKLVHINRQIVIYDGGEKSGFGHSGLSGNIFAMEKGELRNLYYAHKKIGICFLLYLFASIFSLLKFVKRYFIVRLGTS